MKGIISKIYLYLTLTLISFGIFSLVSCTDDINVREGGFLIPEGTISINFDVPEETYVKTRADLQSSEEASLSNVILVFCNENDEGNLQKCVACKEISNVADPSRVNVEIPEAVKSLDSFNIIAVANISASEKSSFLEFLAQNPSYSELESYKLENYHNGNETTGQFEMSGKAKCTSISDPVNITLIRSAAKISLATSEEVSEFILESFSLYNSNLSGYAISGISKDNVFCSDEETGVILKGEEDFIYTWPTESAGTGDIGSFIIAEGKYDGGKCFYRIDLRKSPGTDGKVSYYDMEPNHWYDITIDKVLEKGYPTAEEASRHPMLLDGDTDPKLIVTIHDHSRNVMSMISDGVRELGVTGVVTINGSTGNLYIRMSCLDPACVNGCKHYPILADNKLTGDNFKIEVTEGSGWLSIGNASPAEGEEQLTPVPVESDTESSGARYLYILKADSSQSIGGELEGKILVTWNGLSREVTVKFQMDFNPTQVLKDTRFIMHDTDSRQDIIRENYWSFLASKDNDSKLYGVDASGENKIRNEGFHFPVMYGKSSSNPWWYEYQVALFKKATLTTYKYFTVTVKNITPGTERVWDEDKFVVTVTSNYNVNNFSEEKVSRSTLAADRRLIYSGNTAPDALCLILKRATVGSDMKGTGGIPDDYTYSTAELVVTLYSSTDPEEKGIEYSFNLYHTGFFHLQPEGYTNNYFYYEVVKLGNNYWLDRNLGAMANGMYVENATASNYGDDNSRGYYYSIAKASTSGSYADPTITDNICPSGYHIPNTTEWDDLRLSPNFKTGQVYTGTGSYMATYYSSENPYIGNIYFPKSRCYYSSGTIGIDTEYKTPNSGDDATGYYWTRTPAAGLEKDEIGNWLKVLTLSGSSNSYINGSVGHHAMSLRCVAGVTPAEDSNNSIDFNVKGATHVYIYSVDDEGNKSGVFSFPGKAIGNQTTVDGLDYNNDNSYLHFSYNTSLDASNFYVFFTYVTEQGKISIISRNNASTFTEAVGWPVKVGYNYFFDKNSHVPVVRNNQFPWLGNGSGGNDNNYFFSSTGWAVKVTWPQFYNGKNVYQIYAWHQDAEKILGEFPGSKNETWSSTNGGLYTKTFPLKQDCNKFYLKFSNVETNPWTETDTYTVEETGNSHVKVTKDESNRVYDVVVSW